MNYLVMILVGTATDTVHSRGSEGLNLEEDMDVSVGLSSLRLYGQD